MAVEHGAPPWQQVAAAPTCPACGRTSLAGGETCEWCGAVLDPPPVPGDSARPTGPAARPDLFSPWAAVTAAPTVAAPVAPASPPAASTVVEAAAVDTHGQDGVPAPEASGHAGRAVLTVPLPAVAPTPPVVADPVSPAAPPAPVAVPEIAPGAPQIPTPTTISGVPATIGTPGVADTPATPAAPGKPVASAPARALRLAAYQAGEIVPEPDPGVLDTPAPVVAPGATVKTPAGPAVPAVPYPVALIVPRPSPWPTSS